MVIVIVEHYLSEKGKSYFPEWIELAKKILNEKDGFISINQLENISKEVDTNILLEFNSLENLRKWSKSDEHHQLLLKISPFQLKKQFSVIYKYS